MKQYIVIFVAALLCIGCSEDEVVNQEPGNESMPVFEAAMDELNGAGRTLMDANKDVLWQDGDQLSIFAQSTANSQYTLTGGAGTTHGVFGTTMNMTAGQTILSSNAAIYPYSNYHKVEEKNKIAGTAKEYTFSLNLPAQQTFAENSFGAGAFPMVAVSADTKLQFKNVCGALRIQLTGSKTIKSVKIKGNKNEALGGNGTTTLTAGSTPSNWQAKARHELTIITLDCGTNGVKLDPSKATSFIFALPPVTFSTGFTILITDTEQGAMTLKTSKTQVIARNTILAMPAKEYKSTPLAVISSESLKNALGTNSDVTSIIFKSNTLAPSTSTLISNKGKGAYLVKNGTDVTIYSEAEAFVFEDDCSNLFQGQSALKSIDFTNCLTPLVTNMEGMFKGCTHLSSLDLRGFNTENVTSMKAMFYGCEALDTLNISSFDTKEVTNMVDMFRSMGRSTTNGTTVIIGNAFKLPSSNTTNMFTGAKIKELVCNENLQGQLNTEKEKPEVTNP